MVVDGNSNEIINNSSTSGQQQPSLATVTCLDIAWAAISCPFHLRPGVNPLEFAALFCPLARAALHLKRQNQPLPPTTESNSTAQSPPNPPPPEPPEQDLLTMTHNEFRDFLSAVEAAFDGLPHLWHRFLQLALKFMQSHSSSPPPDPRPA